MSLTAGTRLGPYEIRSSLGAGGMGEVYRARDTQLNRDVAVKVLPEPVAGEPASLPRFLQEARAASALNHPNILTIHDIGEAAGRPYIVMEFVDGRTLREVLNARPLPAKRVLDLAVQLADGLAKAHAAGIIHRDLKPENVMVTGDGIVKIVDFGLAKPVAPFTEAAGARGSQAQTTIEAPLTASGAIVGTVGYMAPEQARGQPVDFRADQFALGAIVYELATGRPAFRAASPLQTLIDIIEHDPAPLEELAPAFPAPARWLVERCLSKEPAGRYASTQDLAYELHTIREHLGETRSDVSRRARPGARHRAWLEPPFAGIAAVLLFALVVAGPGLWRAARARLAGPPAPGAMRVAVLPISEAGIAGEVTAGLFDYVVARLADLHRVRPEVSVVPASEIVDSGVRTPRAAERALRATRAVSVALARKDRDVIVTASVSDARQQLNGGVLTCPVHAFSPERVAEQVVHLLDVQLAGAERAAWAGGASPVAGANAFFAQGLGETPYQQARTATERYDQQVSLETAIQLFNKAVDADPAYATALAGLGEAHLRLYRLTKENKHLSLAETLLRKALDLDSTRPAAWMSLGMLYTLQGNTANAAQAFDEAVARNPSDADVHRELGLTCQRAGQPAKAEAAFRRAIALRSDLWSNHNALANFLIGAGRYAEAEMELLAARASVPDNARVLANLGALYMLQKRWDDAESVLNEAVAFNPASGAALSNLGSLLFSHRGNYREAARLYASAAHATPRDYRVWYNLGLARARTPGLAAEAGDAYAHAASLLEEELKVDATNTLLLVRLADCRAALGEVARARAVVARALAQKPGGEELRIAAGVYERTGDRDGALRLLRRALENGADLRAVEGSSALENLRKDERYAGIVRAVGGGPKKGEARR